MDSKMTPSSTFAPHQSSPLARAIPPFKDPRTPPCTRRNTARLWDEYERRAVENAKRRDNRCSDTSLPVVQSERFSNSSLADIIRSYDSDSSPRIPAQRPNKSSVASPQFDFEFQTAIHPARRPDPATSTTIAICKTCKRTILSVSGICERCKMTVVLTANPGELTPPLAHFHRNFGTTDLAKLSKKSPSGTTTPISPPSKHKSSRPPANQLNEVPIRLSSLRPPASIESTPASSCPTPQEQRSRAVSLTDPNEPYLRLQISRKPIPVPSLLEFKGKLQLSTPVTPPSSLHSQASHSRSQSFTRPLSLSNLTTPQQTNTNNVYTKHTSATPSELSTLHPYVSNASTPATATSSVYRASYNLQNTMSAWDWDSDDDGEERTGLVGYWKGKMWKGSRVSLAERDKSANTSGSGRAGFIDRHRGASISGSGSGRRESNSDRREPGGNEGKKRKRGFVRVISCGCADKE